MKFCESFGGARKSKPRDLHIRKVSFSGSSVSSGSFSSISSTSSSSTFSTVRKDSTSTRATSTASSSSSAFSFDPLALHPTFQAAAPPRLHNRPFIPMDGQRYQDISAFYDDSEDDKSDFEVEHACLHHQESEDELPPHVVAAAADEADQEGDFFMSFASRCSHLPSSRWSDSTIASIQTLEDLPSPSNSIPSEALMILTGEEEVEELAGQDVSESIMVAKRPTMKPMDGFNDFVKRGGWKRRGIVFHQDDVSGGFELL